MNGFLKWGKLNTCNHQLLLTSSYKYKPQRKGSDRPSIFLVDVAPPGQGWSDATVHLLTPRLRDPSHPRPLGNA